MSKGEYSVILVNSTGHAIRGEKLLQNAGVGCKLIPVPRQLSSNCGVCLRVARTDRSAAQGILHDAGLEIGDVHDI